MVKATTYAVGNEGCAGMIMEAAIIKGCALPEIAYGRGHFQSACLTTTSRAFCQLTGVSCSICWLVVVGSHASTSLVSAMFYRNWMCKFPTPSLELGLWPPNAILKPQNLYQPRPFGLGGLLQVLFPPPDGQGRNPHNLSNIALFKTLFIAFDQEVIAKGLDGRGYGSLGKEARWNVPSGYAN